ncbi:MAG TPA: hypothetical protein VFU72_16035, partial [Nitrolancea sp.]|nr:hypothetical protein [Nitrolancea sp.]
MGGDQLVVKRIVVLANSYKHDGRCVAGREVAVAEDGRVTFGGWLRPVNDTEDGELLPEQCRLQDGSLPRPLDIIDIPCSGPQGDPTQPENWLLAGGTNWRRAGRLSPDHLPELAERPAQLWPDDSSYTDRV